MKAYLVIIPLAYGLMSCCGEAQAEQGCPAGMVPGAAPTGTPGAGQCVPMPGGIAPAVPQERWQTLWGAISFDSEAGKYGTSNAMPNRRKAEKAAIKHCASKGARDCKIVLAYNNQCGAMAVSGGDMTVTSAATKEQAEASAIDGCESKTGDGQCKIYYSDCSYSRRTQ